LLVTHSRGDLYPCPQFLGQAGIQDWEALHYGLDTWSIEGKRFERQILFNKRGMPKLLAKLYCLRGLPCQTPIMPKRGNYETGRNKLANKIAPKGSGIEFCVLLIIEASRRRISGL
jgi:hypothetical protein